jgi:hypothetical protein
LIQAIGSLENCHAHLPFESKGQDAGGGRKIKSTCNRVGVGVTASYPILRPPSAFLTSRYLLVEDKAGTVCDKKNSETAKSAK